MGNIGQEKGNLNAQDPNVVQTPPAYHDGNHEMNAMPAMVPGTQQQAQTHLATAVPLERLQDMPAPVDCPSCHVRAITRTEFVSGNTTNAWALGLCIFTCCCCIPYLIDNMKDVVHKCGNCGIGLATWHRSGRTVVSV